MCDMFRFLHRRAYATASALQNIDKQHERILRVVQRRITERTLISSQASFFSLSLTRCVELAITSLQMRRRRRRMILRD